MTTPEHVPPTTRQTGWRVQLVEETIGTEAHVIPVGQEHQPNVACWCQPSFEASDFLGPRVWLHRRSHDHGHRYRDDEG